jgi:acyl CoA:acetate/3-ketoacid CoA transferase beta subunit
VVNLIVTDLGVFDVDHPGQPGLTLVDIAPGVTVDELRAKTEAGFRVHPDLKVS